MIEKNGKCWQLYIITYYKAFGKLSGITKVIVVVLIDGVVVIVVLSSYRMLKEILYPVISFVSDFYFVLNSICFLLVISSKYPTI